MIRFVTLDATGTVMHAPRLGEIYSTVLARHGVQIEASRAAQLVREVWAEFDCSATMDRDRFATHPEGPRGWWRQFLDRFCEHLDSEATPFAAAELYDTFGRAESWELYDDVIPFLDQLGDTELTAAVISNWDPRLPGVLDGLGLGSRLEGVFYSAEVGFEKPHPGIFESALAGLGAEPEEVVHVGDSGMRDVEGAQAVGMHAIHLRRTGRGEARSLGEVAPLIERLCYVRGR